MFSQTSHTTQRRGGRSIDAAKVRCLFPLSEINDVLGPFAINSMNVARLHGQDLMVSSNSIKSSFNFAAKNRADLKPTSDKLNKRYKKAKQDEKDAKKAKTDGTANGTEGSTPTEPAS